MKFKFQVYVSVDRAWVNICEGSHFTIEDGHVVIFDGPLRIMCLKLNAGDAFRKEKVAQA